MNEEIFKFLDPKSNVMLSKMNATDLRYLLTLLKDTRVTFRDTLGLNENYIFGNELEYADAIDSEEIEEEVEERFPNYTHEEEPSTGYYGGEVITPVLTDTKENWYELRDVCNMIKHLGGIADNSCGGHNHVGFNTFEDVHNLTNFVKFWMANENIIYRFGYGDTNYPRPKLDLFAYPVAKKWESINFDLMEQYPVNRVVATLIYGQNYEYVDFNPKSFGVNFANAKDINRSMPGNTVEFRYANGTLNPATIQNNNNCNAHIIKYCTSDNFDYEQVDRFTFENKDNFSNLKSYQDLNLRQALIFADTIFDNNIDKIFFLKQYIKDESIEDEKLLIKK